MGSKNKKCLYCGGDLRDSRMAYCCQICKTIDTTTNPTVKAKAIERYNEMHDLDERIKFYLKHDFTLEMMYEVIKTHSNKEIKKRVKVLAKDLKVWIYRDPPNTTINTTWLEKLRYNRKLMKKVGWVEEDAGVRTHYEGGAVKRGRIIK